MSDQYLGEIRTFGFNFAPVGWALCQGQTLSISANTALFSLLGTFYGGNGTTTFQLPDLQGRVPINQGTGAGLPAYTIGEKAGSATVTLLTNNLPQHTHPVTPAVNTSAGNLATPVSNYLAVAPSTSSGGTHPVITSSYASTPTPNSFAGVYQTGITGGNLPIQIEPPFLCLNFCIALQGIYPTRA